MARPTEWRRSAASYADGGTSSSLHTVKLCDLAPGETITRVRFWYWAGQYPAFPFSGSGIALGLGIGVFGSGTPTIWPLSEPNHDWLWWEAFTLQTDTFVYDPMGEEVNLLTGPEGKYERDGRAQRRNDGQTTESVWLITESVDGFQGQHYLSYGASCLVMLPA